MTFDREQIVARLAEEDFDVLVIGGGVTGCGIALDAASRGLRTALVEAGDFAQGTSSRSSKMVHGGIRYLQRFELGLVREALTERSRLLANAPHLVRKLPFILPVMRNGGPIPWYVAPFMRLVLLAYDMAGGNDPGWRHEKLDAAQTVQRVRLLDASKLRRSYLYYDAWVDDARLTLTLARTAALDHGAALVNHAELVDVMHGPEGVIDGARVAIDGREIGIRARSVVNAGGVWASDVADLDASGNGFEVQPAIGVHIVVDRNLVDNDAAVILPAGKQTIFAVPWGDHTYIGTTDLVYDGDLRGGRCTGDDVDYLLGAVNESVTKPVPIDAVRGSWAGLRPLIKAEGETRDLSRRHQVLVSDDGLVSVIGGKLTTYRAMAEDAVDAVVDRLGIGERSRTAGLRLRGAVTPPDDADHLALRYGSEAGAVAALIEAEPDLGRPLVTGLPYLGAEVVWAVRQEMARTVDDVLSRRLRAHLLDREASAAAAHPVARLMGAELGWSPEEEATEVERYLAIVEADRDALAHRAERQPVAGTNAWAPGLGRPVAMHDLGRSDRLANPWLGDDLKNISHQGGTLDREGFGENTVAGYQRGLDNGWVLDTDLRATADGYLIAFHDEAPGVNESSGRSVDLTGSNQPIAERELAEIQRNVKIVAPDGARHDIATFADIIALVRQYPDALLSIEAKTMSAAELLVEQLNDPANRDIDLVGRTVFFGMSVAIRDVLRRGLGPRAVTGLSKREVVELLAAAALSRLPGLGDIRISTSADVAAIPHTPGEMSSLRRSWLPDAFVDADVITSSVIETARRSGLIVLAWTVDDPAIAERLVGRGVTGIYSDRPEIVFPHLAERESSWRPESSSS